MAAAFVPLIATIAPEIINLIAALTNKAAPIAEATHGAATGPVKFTDVFNVVITALNNAAIAGQISKALPSDDIVKIVIQAVVSCMQLNGLLGANSVSGVPGTAATTISSVTTANTTAAQQFLNLKSGQSVVISVA